MIRKLFLVLTLLLISSAAHAQVIGDPVAPTRSTAAEASRVFKTSYGQFYGFSAVSTAAGYVLIYDRTTAPADGAVQPMYCYNAPANTAVGASWGSIPAAFINGLVMVFSTTGCYTQTSSATAFFSAQVR